MPDPALHGNGIDCPACKLRRENAHGIGGAVDIPCNQCNGTGRIARPTAEIVAEAVAEARIHHWANWPASLKPERSHDPV